MTHLPSITALILATGQSRWHWYPELSDPTSPSVPSSIAFYDKPNRPVEQILFIIAKYPGYNWQPVYGIMVSIWLNGPSFWVSNVVFSPRLRVVIQLASLRCYNLAFHECISLRKTIGYGKFKDIYNSWQNYPVVGNFRRYRDNQGTFLLKDLRKMWSYAIMT